jgi:CRP/FNR family transcriptional regulator, transcriptional activator FtrB
MPMFADLDRAQRERLLDGAELQTCAANIVLFDEGGLPEFLHMLVRGTVELYKGDTPRECGLMLLAPGDVFMPAAALFAEPYLNSARALTQCQLLLLKAEVVRREYLRSHQLAINVGRVLAGQFRMATRHIIDLKCLNAAQRLAILLLRLVDESEGPESARLPVSKRHLASRVGMTPETLSRAIQILADNGLVVRGAKIILRDRARIEAFCGAPPYPHASETDLDVHML